MNGYKVRRQEVNVRLIIRQRMLTPSRPTCYCSISTASTRQRAAARTAKSSMATLGAHCMMDHYRENLAHLKSSPHPRSLGCRRCRLDLCNRGRGMHAHPAIFGPGCDGATSRVGSSHNHGHVLTLVFALGRCSDPACVVGCDRS
jgi:hypothetical protein